MPASFDPLSDSLSGSAWQHARRRQLAGLDVGAEALQQGLSDDLPIEQWLLVRDRQLRGQAPVGALQKATPLRSDRDMAASLQVAASTRAKPATGVKQPPLTGRPEVSAAGIRGHGAKLPDRIRIYNTPTGELDAELSGPLSVGPFRIRKGVYVIGQPDPLKRK